MKTVLLNIYDEKVEIIDVKDDLDEFYEKLNCRLIDIVKRKIGNKWFSVMCDDEGLLIDAPKISAIDSAGRGVMFVGNLMFFHNDGKGRLVGLSDDDIAHIKKYIKRVYTLDYPAGYPMLTNCEY